MPLCGRRMEALRTLWKHSWHITWPHGFKRVSASRSKHISHCSHIQRGRQRSKSRQVSRDTKATHADRRISRAKEVHSDLSGFVRIIAMVLPVELNTTHASIRNTGAWPIEDGRWSWSGLSFVRQWGMLLLLHLDLLLHLLLHLLLGLVVRRRKRVALLLDVAHHSAAIFRTTFPAPAP